MEAEFFGAMAILTYLYNTSPMRMVEDVYGTEHHQDYLDEKAKLFRERPVYAIGMLDTEHRHRLFRIALERHRAAENRERLARLKYLDLDTQP